MVVDQLATYEQNQIDPESFPESYSNAHHNSYLGKYSKTHCSYENLPQFHSLDKRPSVPSYHCAYDENSLCKSDSVPDTKLSEILPSPQPLYSALSLAQTADQPNYSHEFFHNLNTWQASQGYQAPTSCTQPSPERSDSGFSSPETKQNCFAQSCSFEVDRYNEVIVKFC